MSQPKLRDRRSSLRFDKVIPVNLTTELFGEIGAIARNVSAGGMLIEMPAPFPLGSEVQVHFQIPDSHGECISVRAEVKNHYSFNYSADGEPRAARGMGIRFLEFLEDGAEVLRSTLTKHRTLH